MNVELKCIPETLDEAEIAKEVESAVEAALAKHGGRINYRHARHVVVRDANDRHEPWSDQGLELVTGGSVDVPGAKIGRIREVRVLD